MRKLLSFALVLMMVLALAVPAIASGNLYSRANIWYFDAEEAGTLTVKDNKETYTYEVVAGENQLDSQSKYTGQLSFVSFEAVHVCDFVKTLVGAEVDCKIEKVSGDRNLYKFVITEEYEYVCECGEKRLPNTFEDITSVISLANNYKGEVEVGDYIVSISSSGNTTVDAVYIVIAE